MNVSKTNRLVLSPKRRSPVSVSVIIKGEEIMQQDQIKYLGVIVDKDLNWKAHIVKVRNKCFAGLSFLRRIKVGHYKGVIHQFLGSCW